MIYILNYQGLSGISKIIQTVTWSKYSHTAIATHEGTTIEAWHKGGVTRNTHPWAVHKPLTPISIYQLKYADQFDAHRIWRIALGEVGKGYDFQALCGFIPGLRWLWKDDPAKWFCSHLIANICKRGSLPLFSYQTPLYKISPKLIDFAEPLTLLGTVTNIREYRLLVNPTEGA